MMMITHQGRSVVPVCPLASFESKGIRGGPFPLFVIFTSSRNTHPQTARLMLLDWAVCTTVSEENEFGFS